MIQVENLEKDVAEFVAQLSAVRVAVAHMPLAEDFLLTGDRRRTGIIIECFDAKGEHVLSDMLACRPQDFDELDGALMLALEEHGIRAELHG
jgi:hypothetical protein